MLRGKLIQFLLQQNVFGCFVAKDEVYFGVVILVVQDLQHHLIVVAWDELTII